MPTALVSILSALKRHFVLVIVFVFVIVIFAGYFAGLRPGPGLTLVRVGTLVVTGVPDGTNVYTDQALRGTASDGSLSAALVPGTHTVIVDAAGEEPAEEVVSITSNETTTISPILVSKKPNQINLGLADMPAARAALAAVTLPTQEAPLTLGCAQVYVADNRVIANAATTSPACATPPDYLCSDGSCAPTIIYSPASPINSLIAFPGRTDAFIIATGEWVYVIGLDPRTPQYFAPIIHGSAPTIAPGPKSGTIYVADQGQVNGVSF